MAIYHLEVKNISRGKGQNSLATLAYISGYKLKDERIGKTFNYRRKDRVVKTLSLTPKGYKGNIFQAFQDLEQFEKADNARIAKHVIVALPREMTLEEDEQALAQLLTPLNKKGYPVCVSIHEDGSGNNPHAHILIANRPMDKHGHYVQSKTKTKSVFALDRNGQRIPVIDKKTGKQKVRKRKGKGEEKVWKRIQTTEPIDFVRLDSLDWLEDMRRRWEWACNVQLESYKTKIDHRSYDEIGLTADYGLMPEIHEGYIARKMEEHGEVSERCEHNRNVRTLNNLICDEKDLKEERNALTEQWKQEQQQEQEEQYPWLKQRDHIIRFSDGTTADVNDLARDAIQQANKPEPPKKNPPKRGRNRRQR